MLSYVNEVDYRELPLDPPAFHWLGEHVVFVWPNGREQKGRVVEVNDRNAEVRIEHWYRGRDGIARRGSVVQPLTNIRLA